MKYFTAALLLTVGLISCSQAPKGSTLSAGDFEKGIAGKNVQLVDVRTIDEYNEGHIKNALLADWTDQGQFNERVKALDKSLPVYTYCLSGARSSSAAAWLREHGFTTVYNLDGGINAWKRENKPVEGVTETKEISLADFNSQIPKDKTVLVDFSAVWCPPCKKMIPVLDSLEKSADNAFVILKYDGGTQTSLAEQLNVNGFPTFIIYKNGVETARKEGVSTYTELMGMLK